MEGNVGKVRQVCNENECDNKPEEVEVGNVKHLFCCMKGFQKALDEFYEYLKSGKTAQNN
jgi:hypothetical protein